MQLAKNSASVCTRNRKIEYILKVPVVYSRKMGTLIYPENKSRSVRVKLELDMERAGTRGNAYVELTT